MPSDVVTIVVSTGIGVSVIAGVLSGVCYILAHGLSKKRSRQHRLQWHCAVCGTYLRTHPLENIQAVICTECEERVCKLRCSKREYVRRGWICYSCLKRPSWLQGIFETLSLRFKRDNSNVKSIMSKEGEKMGESADPLRQKEKDCVRDFIEKLVSTILGGSVDDASISRMYTDKHYDILFEKYHQDLSNAITNLSSALHLSINNSTFADQTPSSAHVNLKQLIEKVLQEVVHLPHFRKAVNSETVPGENERTYEELLATAVINKIIAKQQNDLPSSSEASVSSNKANKEYFFGDGAVADLESTSVSSLDEYLHSDSSLGSTKYVDRVSLTIQQRIEELPTSELEDVEADFYLRTSSSSLLAADESNWYLQKRQFSGTHSPIPVPMLVPNPLTSAKVLIGDKEVDETSDLSDAASDCADDIDSPNRNLLIDSSIVIGESVAQNNSFSDEETSFDSGVREDREEFSDREKFENVAPKTDITVDDENVEDVSLISLQSNTEKDSEYLEKYASLPKTVFRSSSPILNSSSSLTEVDRDAKYESLNFENQIKDHYANTPFFEGSYSKKEKEKWSKPIEMENNPYTTENIRRRIRTNERFGRDYYTKLASSPSGKAKNDEEHNFRPPDEDAEVSWYRAVPATTNESDTEERTNSLKTEKEDVPVTNLLEITSDSDLSLVNFYDVENSKIYFQPSDNDQPDFRITLNKKAPNMFNGDGVKWHSPVPVVRVNEKEPIFYSPEQPVKTEPPKPQERDDDENMTNVQSIVITTKKTKQVEHETKIYRPTVDGRKETEINNNGVGTAKRTDPLISTKKSDNTLIKKIYSNPVVRSFALTNREQIPYETEPQVTKVPLTPVRENAFPRYDRVTTPVKEFAPPKYEYSTGYAKTPVKEEAPPKFENVKSPVREFAPPKFEHDTGYVKSPVREFAPPRYEYSTAKTSPREDAPPKYEYNSSYIMRPAEKTGELQEERGQAVNEKVDKREDVFSLEFSENGSSKEQESDDFDVNELRERKLVASRLGQFSKSFPNLLKIKPTETQQSKPDEGAKELETNGGDASPEERFVSVRDLKKLFERRDAARYEKDKPVHSLTARSISKQMKETLKGDSSIHNGTWGAPQNGTKI